MRTDASAQTAPSIRLESLNEEHIPAIIEGCQDWRELSQFGVPFWRPRSTAELRRKVSAMSGPQPATAYNFIIVDSASDEAVGECSVHGIDWRNRVSHVGIFIWRPVSRHHGYGKAALAELVHWATDYLGLHRLEARILINNAASIRLFERAGFAKEGTAHQLLLIDGQYRDMHLYAHVGAAMQASEDPPVAT